MSLNPNTINQYSWCQSKIPNLASSQAEAQQTQSSMRRLSHWSGQQQHLLQQVQALGAQEMHVIIWGLIDKGP